jgi:hypothetical protein
MSYGFGTTFGTDAATDRIELETAGAPAIFTFLIWAYRQGAGGGSAGRLFDDGHILILNNESGTPVYQLTRGFSITGGVWTAPSPSTAAWHPVILRYDGTSVITDPLVDFETAQTVTEVTAPDGVVTTASTVRFLGNRELVDRAWDGKLAEFALWNRILTDPEVAQLAAGDAPSLISSGLIHYRPLISTAVDSITSDSGSVTGALVQADHPAITYPSVSRPRGLTTLRVG